MRMVVPMIVAGALMASAAQAAAQPVAETGQKIHAGAVTPDPGAARAKPSKVLVVCNADEDARLVARDVDFGFITAQEVLAGREWSGPKCITAKEAQRLGAIGPMAAK